MNKINQLFDSPLEQRGTGTPSLPGKLLSLYFCAGCPELNMTADVILTLQRRGISMIEVGIAAVEAVLPEQEGADRW